MSRMAAKISDRFFLILSIIAVSPIVVLAIFYTTVDYLVYSTFLRGADGGKR